MGILQTFAQLGQKCDMELRFKYLEMETLKETYCLFSVYRIGNKWPIRHQIKFV